MTKARGVGNASTRERQERTALILATITEAGEQGIAAAELDIAAGVIRDALLRHLGRLRREGKVVCIKAAWNTKYVLAEYAEKAIAERDATSVARRNQREKVRQTAQRRARKDAAISRVLNVRQRIVSAADAPPLRARGPSSVFDLAAM